MPVPARRVAVALALLLGTAACAARAVAPGDRCTVALEQRCYDAMHVVVCREGTWVLEAWWTVPPCTPGEPLGRCAGGSPSEHCPCTTRGWFCSGPTGYFCSGSRWEYGICPTYDAGVDRDGDSGPRLDSDVGDGGELDGSPWESDAAPSDDAFDAR